MKHFITLSASLFISATLAACGSGNDGSSSSDAPKTVAPSTTTQTQPTAQAKPKPDRGAVLYKKCVTCHTLKDGERHKVGPNLYAIAGATAGTKEGFAYSRAMKASGLIWTDENLDGYIENPNKFMPGNKMTFVGIRKAEDRKLLIEYMKKESAPKE